MTQFWTGPGNWPLRGIFAGRKEVGLLFTPVPYIIPAQLFAACLAHQKGLDPDRPGTLTKITRTL